MENVWIALGLTFLAGMATGAGSLIAFTVSRTNFRFLSISTGFSAGVMLYISFVEIFQKGISLLSSEYGEYPAHWINAGAFFSGLLLIAFIDNIVPSFQNPHETHSEEERAPLHNPEAPLPAYCLETLCDEKSLLILKGCIKNKNYSADSFIKNESAGAGMSGEGGSTGKETKFLRMGLFTALVIGIHNFPEGLATFFAALQEPGIAIGITMAVALHNIPEGISISVPIFYATGNRKKAFYYSLLSGMAEPVGAAVAYLSLLFFSGGGPVPSGIIGALYAATAGIMVYISLDELLPASRAYGKGHDSLLGLIAGMAMMSLSLLIMK